MANNELDFVDVTVYSKTLGITVPTFFSEKLQEYIDTNNSTEMEQIGVVFDIFAAMNKKINADKGMAKDNETLLTVSLYADDSEDPVGELEILFILQDLEDETYEDHPMGLFVLLPDEV